jgi:hypothetical protein
VNDAISRFQHFEVRIVPRLSSPASMRSLSRTLIVAAGIAAIGLVQLRSASLFRPHRSVIITAAVGPGLVQPIGDVGQARTFSWRLVAGADRYRVVLFDAGARTIFEAELPDTTLIVPDSIAIGPEQSYLWKVEVRTEWQRWTSSELREFRVIENRSWR